MVSFRLLTCLKHRKIEILQRAVVYLGANKFSSSVGNSGYDPSAV